MALPTSYTEEDFAAYLHGELRGIAGVLGLVADGDYDEIINDSLVAYGTQDISTITGDSNIVKLRDIGKWQAWTAAVKWLAEKYNYRQNNEQFDLAALQKQAERALQLSERAVSVYGLGPYTVQISRVVRTQDPYGYLPEELRTIP